MNFQRGRRNLICVLDWGIGHASRSLALAKRLVDQGELVDFAGAGNALEMLKREWNNDCTFHSLPAYDIDYQSSNMVWNIGLQFPRIVRTVFQEHKVLVEILRRVAYDRVISDSRFGCFANQVQSVMLTHQLYPIFGFPLVGFLYQQYLSRNFNAFWVPDYSPPKNMSGELSRSKRYKNVQYIGPLSRLPLVGAREKHYDYGCLLSGPEPQRTYLEQQLIAQLSNIPGYHLVVAGQPARVDQEDIVVSPDIRIKRIAFSSAEQTALLLRQSKKIICRSGYSTLMDLDHLEIEAVLLIPTPGQTEQIYLAKRWSQMGRASWIAQADLQLLP